ncbi:MAG: sulfatase-like hydrolase/transferase [Flavobacteriales bacterium]
MRNNRSSLLISFIIIFLIISFGVRVALTTMSFPYTELTILSTLRTFSVGSFFDLGVSLFLSVPYAVYLCLCPKHLIGTFVDRAISIFIYVLMLLIICLAFFAEFPFWEEFNARFDFIAVDYLIYTHEVVQNIQESYPLSLLIGGILLCVTALTFIIHRMGVFKKTFQEKVGMKKRGLVPMIVILGAIYYALFIANADAEHSINRYQNELSKAGIYSFFDAFRSNELNYEVYYKTRELSTVWKETQELLKSDHVSFSSKNKLLRKITPPGIEIRPNIILILMESMSANFMERYGNNQKLTPTLDILSRKSLTFDGLFATGTRTVRGIEAISLSIPPTPGQSIVKRRYNTQLYSIGKVFRDKGYSNKFIYGGDGFFDNMNQFFGNNGFSIIDRGRGYLMGDDFKAQRENIQNEEVSFENAWGICDEDIYRRVLKEADRDAQSKTPFFYFILTTSNHRPYTYPKGKIDIPSGSGRAGAVKYSDYAIKKIITQASQKPWFQNTVFVIIADHYASSAGKNEINVGKYHVPGMIYNIPNLPPKTVKTLCSQVDIFPTLFNLLNWSYESKMYGKDILKMSPEESRAFVSTYQKLGLMKQDRYLAILSPKKTAQVYRWDAQKNLLTPVKANQKLINETINYYQSAYQLYKTKLYRHR